MVEDSRGLGDRQGADIKDPTPHPPRLPPPSTLSLHFQCKMTQKGPLLGPAWPPGKSEHQHLIPGQASASPRSSPEGRGKAWGSHLSGISRVALAAPTHPQHTHPQKWAQQQGHMVGSEQRG